MSKKETRRLYCDEEELEYAKHCIQQRRAGLILQNMDSDPNGALVDKLDLILTKIEDLNSEVSMLQSYSIRELGQKINKLDNKLEQLGSYNY